MIQIALYIVAFLVGGGLLAMLLFGARSLSHGKISPISMAMIALPIVILAVLGLVMGDWVTAAIYTVAIMLGLGILALLLTGVKGVFS